ncbi:MAG: amidohydrolase family protein [Candidatus Hydrogenedentes bacterium]|nr:amidohydrolase family protein [Candidatus Hydrogenedentota bacterium]
MERCHSRSPRWGTCLCGTALLLCALGGAAQDTRDSRAYRYLKQHFDQVRAIDTHDHLRPFELLGGVRETDHGKGMNLAGLWADSYFPWCNALTPWKPGMSFEAWWGEAKDDFDNARAMSFYQYMLPAFQDLYGVDFNRISDAQAATLDRRIFNHYQRRDWVLEVVTQRANIEWMLIDPNWNRLGQTPAWPFEVLVFNVTTLGKGFHPSQFKSEGDNPYAFAAKQGLAATTLDEYLTVLDKLFAERKAAGAACLKTTLAYERTLQFDPVTRERAEQVFGKTAEAVSAEDRKAFEDFIMWRLCELGAKYELPFQIHTGQARIQGSNPMLLVDLIQANRETKFILFHGGFPWIGEMGVIIQRHWKNVWVDSCWLPTLSYSMAKRAYQEWIEMFPANRILWGADSSHAEGIYGATAFTRQCLAEALAEKVAAGDLSREEALSIGRKILRENALELFPQLRQE